MEVLLTRGQVASALTPGDHDAASAETRSHLTSGHLPIKRIDPLDQTIKLKEPRGVHRWGARATARPGPARARLTRASRSLDVPLLR
jgi:hypothetical protein